MKYKKICQYEVGDKLEIKIGDKEEIATITRIDDDYDDAYVKVGREEFVISYNDLIKHCKPLANEGYSHKGMGRDCNLSDIQEELKYMLKYGQISQGAYDKLCEKIELVLEFYEDYLKRGYDWRYSLSKAIDECVIAYKMVYGE